ncbi:hypothetical protein OMAG_000025 [Candidatus Omnitrophus magneticus]|uniref:Uncharacterized protein n=1 Tax=Candidatus Omnitrophus magneticus TaxID=1609969 RepID=A0A0F0CX00_9BACT|nr:hypothetical protein OMAG_000747 [Candidatus Omnitrophus magneticus]KJJ86093.1 hypothetical protein OMAG_000041 [Candidatus Omnitrophus magneticus]KJJ86106.1 hypothetical protein OMAG_000025 [Candidatus Omnitrophus magneticus]
MQCRAREIILETTRIALFSIIFFPRAICYNLEIFIYKIIWRDFFNEK